MDVESTIELAETSGVRDPRRWLIDVFGGEDTDSGAVVNGWTVLTDGPVYAATSMISGDMATMPIDILESQPGNDVKDRSHPAYRLLNFFSGDDVNAVTFRETLQSHALIHGNGLAKIIRNRLEQPIAFEIWGPGTYYPDRDPADGRIRYVRHTPRRDVIFSEDAFHIRDLGTPHWGYSRIDLARQTVGGGLAQIGYANRTLQNSATPSGVLVNKNPTRDDLSETGRERLRDLFYGRHRGFLNAGHLGILPEGWEWLPTAVTHEQAQFLESRKYHREEVALWFKLPPHKLGALENSSVRSNLEEQNKDYLQQTLLPWIVKWEQEIWAKLLSFRQRERQTHYARFNTRAILRTTLDKRYAAYAIGRQWGWLSANDVLRLEDSNTIGDQGDIYLVPLNMADAETGRPFSSQAEVMQELRAFAATQMQAVQREEFRHAAISNGELAGFYERLVPRMIERLKPLTRCAGFVSLAELGEICEQYARESMALLDVDQAERLATMASWPNRAYHLVDGLHKRKDD